MPARVTDAEAPVKITKTAIRRAVTFSMIYIIAVGFGLFSLGRLRIDLWPKLDFPVIAVITQYTGVGPFDIEDSLLSFGLKSTQSTAPCCVQV